MISNSNPPATYFWRLSEKNLCGLLLKNQKGFPSFVILGWGGGRRKGREEEGEVETMKSTCKKMEIFVRKKKS